VESLGIWESVFNPEFNYGEFATIRSQHPDAAGNIRDHAPLEQLVVLTNLESLNSVLIRQGLPQPERLLKLNEIAITQMRTLLSANNVQRLK
jgi:hypothetical protein